MAGDPRSGAVGPAPTRGSAIVFVAFQTSPQANGGIASFAHIVARLLGHRRIIVTDRSTPAMRELADAGADVWYLAPSAPREAHSGAHRELAAVVGKAPAILAANRQIFSIVRETGATVVHCNDISALWHAAIGARAAGAKVVFNVRSIFDADRPYGLKWRLAREVSHVFLTLSGDMASELDRRVPPLTSRGARTVVIHSIVDLDRMKPPTHDERATLRAELAIHRDEFLVVFVGALWEVKGQLPFLQRAAPLLLADPRMRLLLVGDHQPESSAYCAACRDAVSALPVEQQMRVGFTGFVSDVERYYRAADATVLASRYEGLARAMIESLACGTPVVSTEVSSAREVLEGFGAGLVAPRFDYELLAAHLARLAADEPDRRAMAIAGRRAAEALFDARQQARRHQELYEQIVDVQSSGGLGSQTSTPWRSA